MNDFGPALTDDQWTKIRQIVHDEALRARVAASFLPLYGPLPGDATTVPKDSLSNKANPTPPPAQRLEVDDENTIRLARVAVNVTVKNHMLADPELAAASILFRRAANIVARVEDAIIFRGRHTPAPGTPPPVPPPIPGAAGLPDVFDVTGTDYDGLADLAANTVQIDAPTADTPLGAQVFAAVVKAITRIEESAYYKPYACVLSKDLFEAVYTPVRSSMVLPADSLPPILNGPLLRSSTLADGTGLVISLQGNPVEIVVGSEINVRYLQATTVGEHLFRVSERFVLRVKDIGAVALIKR